MAGVFAGWSDALGLALFLIACGAGIVTMAHCHASERLYSNGEWRRLRGDALRRRRVSRGVVGFAINSPVDNESLPGVDTLRYIPQTGLAALGAGGLLAAAVTIARTSWLILRTAVFGPWLAWVGAAAILLVAANVALSGVIAIPAMLVWTAGTSIALWRGGGKSAATRTGPPRNSP